MQMESTETKPRSLRTEESKQVLALMCSEILKANKSQTMIEVGSYMGESTSVFANFFGKVISIDPFLVGMDITEGTSFTNHVLLSSAVEAEFDNVVVKNPNIVKIKDFDYNAITLFEDQSLDFIYLDALHTKKEVQRQIEAWLPKIKPTGWIGGHDFSYEFIGVISRVYDLLGIPTYILRDEGNSWVKKLSEPINF